MQLEALRSIGLVALLWFGVVSAAVADVRVFAAASLKTAMDAAASAYALQTGTTPVLVYGGSSSLARQIAFGAPADLFVSANSDWMDETERAGHISRRIDLLSNELVLIGASGAAPLPVETGFPLVERLGGQRLATALVDSVPAGIYARQALQSVGVWDDVAPFVAQTVNVRAALRLVATGATPLGVVYRTDALAEPAVAVLGTFPDDSHAPIVYPAALLTGAGPDAAAFWDWLVGEDARRIFLDHGFRPAETAP